MQAEGSEWLCGTSPMNAPDSIDSVLESLQQANLTIPHFISSILSLEWYQQHSLVIHLQSHGSKVCKELDHLLAHSDDHSDNGDGSGHSEPSSKYSYY